jgi:hypothetical protein
MNRADALFDADFDRDKGYADDGYFTNEQLERVMRACEALRADETNTDTYQALADVVDETEARVQAGQRAGRARDRPR